jgi:uncharacterized protein
MDTLINFYYFFRYFLLQSIGLDIITSGGCYKCGSCCRKLILFLNGRIIKKETQFKRMKKKNPKYECLSIIEHNYRGHLVFSCSWLKDDNTCANYENRLDVCRGYPEQILFFTRVKPNANCGYTLELGKPFHKILKKKLKKKHKEKFTLDPSSDFIQSFNQVNEKDIC